MYFRAARSVINCGCVGMGRSRHTHREEAHGESDPSVHFPLTFVATLLDCLPVLLSIFTHRALEWIKENLLRDLIFLFLSIRFKNVYLSLLAAKALLALSVCIAPFGFADHRYARLLTDIIE